MTVSLREFHRTALAKFLAACLIALSVSPFTAPFSTFDHADLLGETAIHAAHGSAKLIQEVSDLGLVAVSVPVLFVAEIHRLSGWALPLDVRAHRSLVLRI